jgi:hypothetical protein
MRVVWETQFDCECSLCLSFWIYEKQWHGMVLVLILVFMVGSAIVKFTMVSRLLEEIYYVKRQITCETFLACWKKQALPGGQVQTPLGPGDKAWRNSR